MGQRFVSLGLNQLTKYSLIPIWPLYNNHRENGGTLGMVPLIINPIYTLYSGYLLGIFPFKGLQQGG